MFSAPLSFIDKDKSVTLDWVSESQFPMPKKVIMVDDTFPAHRYTSLASQGTSFVWNGNYHNAKNLLQAVQRRIKKPDSSDTDLTKEFYRHRQFQAYRAQLLGRLLIRVEADLSIQLPKAPDLRQIIVEAITPPKNAFLVSLRELLGFVGAYEWRKKGISIAALEAKKIHAHYGVFSPIRGEYLNLIAHATLPGDTKIAFDIGTGSGVISAILAQRGIPNIIATDMDSRAIACANENIKSLGFEKQVRIEMTNLFPQGNADLIICNPPWLPAKPTSSIENAVYDEGSQMLKGFLNGVGKHLNDRGQAWLIISDLAEHLGLRKTNELSEWIQNAKLKIIETLETRPTHSKINDENDILHLARSKEVTKLLKLEKA
ncbi:MAG: class I SAM-dependent methyltransferase [Bdellovibrionaceae bacterium]|nr:class I SAM-dependent methyltransferase [Pseudobdellovibrionaceae bacterium]